MLLLVRVTRRHSAIVAAVAELAPALAPSATELP
jgi:hypothetical protein